MCRITNCFISVFVVLLIIPCIAGASDPASLTLQIHPYLPVQELFDRFAPLAKYLTEKTHIQVTCRVSKNYQEHIELVGKDGVDLAYMGPASYVIMTGKYGRKPLLARLEINGTPLFQGVIITRQGSSIRTIRDLKGKSFAFGDPNSTMSYFVPLFMMQKAGVGKDMLGKQDFLSSHQNVALGVLMGDFDAGAVKEEVFVQFKERGLSDLAWSPKISEHLFVTNSTLPGKTVDILKSALLGLHDKAVLSSIKPEVSALVPVSDSDYDNLRTIIMSLELDH